MLLALLLFNLALSCLVFFLNATVAHAAALHAINRAFLEIQKASSSNLHRWRMNAASAVIQFGVRSTQKYIVARKTNKQTTHLKDTRINCENATMEQVRILILAASVPSILSTVGIPVAYWNVPSEYCFNKGHLKNLDSYKIQDNTGHKFHGDKVVIFYESTFGRYPYFNKYNELAPVNGGSPLEVDLEDHLKISEKNITTLIPDTTFKGLAVLDFEEWRPLFRYNPGGKQVYKNHSISYARIKYPKVTDPKELENIAADLYNQAAREFINETLHLGKSLRPNGLWGFYGLPYCNYDAGEKEDDFSCSQEFQGFNDDLEYIYNESTALFPSIYLGSPGHDERHFRYILDIISEAVRFSRKHEPPLPVYAYTKFEYNPLTSTDSFYNDYDLCSTVKQSFDLGVHGIVFWSSSSNMPARCQNIQKYLDDKLGPVVRHVIEEHLKCRKTKCSDHGRCVLQEPANMRHLTKDCATFDMNHDDYKCKCDPDYEGSDCSTLSDKRLVSA